MDPTQHNSMMTQLICMGDGTYTFGSTEALKEFLSIDGECVANAKTALCKNSRMNAVKKMEPQFEKVVSDGFPSKMTASKLREVAKGCICWRHESQHNDIYDDWTRRLWVAYLEKNGVGNIPVDSETPALEDKKKWKKVLRQLKRQPPAQAGMYTAVRAISKPRLTPIQQTHLSRNECPPPLI